MNPTIAAALAAAAALSAPAAAQEATGHTPEGWEEIRDSFHFSPAVRAGDFVYISGVVAGRPEDEDPDQAAYEARFERAFAAVGDVLGAAGASWADVVEMTTFHVDFGDEVHRAAFMAVRDRHIGEPYPAWTAIGVDRLWPDNGLVEIKVVAYAPQQTD